jgi:hypothetical protein
MEYEIQRCTRHCAVSGRELSPSEEVYSVLIEKGSELVREDYAKEAWQGPPEGALGWWKSQIPTPENRRAHWAPNDVMLQFFEQLAEQPHRQDMRYVLALLLVRRRVMRVEEESHDEAGHESLVLYCPRRDATYTVPVVMPDEPRVQQIQDELAALLVGREAPRSQEA